MTTPMTLTGDVVCIGPTPGNASFFQACILLMGGWSTHNAILYVNRNRQEYVLDIASPHCRLIPFREYRERCEDGKSRMVIIRHHNWSGMNIHGATYAQWRVAVAAVIRYCDHLQIPYDWRGIITQARNWLRARLHLKAVVGQCEHKIYCTEGVNDILEATEIYPMSALPEQAFPAPIHYERLLKLGVFYVVENCGVDEWLLQA